MPASRQPPPTALRHRRARSTTSAGPQRTLPTGAASPFEMQNVTVSACSAIVRGSTPRAPVHVAGEPPVLGHLADRGQRVEGPADAAVPVLRVLQADGSGDRLVYVG